MLLLCAAGEDVPGSEFVQFTHKMYTRTSRDVDASRLTLPEDITV